MSAHDLLTAALPDPHEPLPKVDARYRHDCGCTFRFLLGRWLPHKQCAYHAARSAAEQAGRQEVAP